MKIEINFEKENNKWRWNQWLSLQRLIKEVDSPKNKVNKKQLEEILS